MKKLASFFGFVFISAQLSAQEYPVTDKKCGTMQSTEYRTKQSCYLSFSLPNAEENAQKWLLQNGSYKNLRNGNITIPVVVHVVYNPSNPLANIPDSIILSQIQVLNEDFNRNNTDAVNTRPVFDTVAADLGITFCLATVDPNGNPTTGIERISSTSSHAFTAFTNSVKASSSGGADPWPVTDYLNLWICDMSFGGSPFVLGYAQFPGDDPATDGVVIQYEYVGRTYSAATAPSNLGRTTTHEVGHWLGLRHIWGDGDCTMDDFVWDTPDADAQSNFDCNFLQNSCTDANNPFWGNSNPPDMVENYMDYSADSCMNMFSVGQGDRIWSFLSTDRSALFNSQGCGTPTVNANSVIQDPTCIGACNGTATVLPVAGVPPFSYLWNDVAATTDSVAVNLCAGVYNCRVIDANQDTIVVTIYVNDPYGLQTAFSVTDASCVSCLDGIITVHATYGTPPYQFSIDGGTPQSDSLFVYLNPGVYSVEVTDSCGNTVTQNVTVDFNNSIAEELAEQFGIYPNPANDFVRVNLGFSGATKKVELMNAIGQSVYAISTSASQFDLNLNTIQSGIYFVRVSVNGALAVKKLIVE